MNAKFPNDARNGDIVVATIRFMHYEGKWIGIENLRTSGIFQRIDPLVIFGGEE